MGYAKDLELLYSNVLNSNFDSDDQSAIGHIWMTNKNNIVLDYDSLLVGNVAGSENISSYSMRDWVLDNKTNLLIRKSSGNIPGVLHYPGIKWGNNWTLYNTIGKHIFLPNNMKPRVVVSLTTTPDRVKLLGPTIKSILKQNYKVSDIYLNIPTFLNGLKKNI